MSGSVVESPAQVRIEGFAGLLRGDASIPLGFDILHLQFIDSACKESADEKEFLIPNWGIV